MKLLNENLEHALSFERGSRKQEVRAQFEKQARAYCKLAAERAARYQLPASGSPQELKQQ